MKKDRPTHKKCRHCKEWFSFSKRAPLSQRFCSGSCWAKYRNANPKWREAQSKRMKAAADPEVMRKMAQAMWRDPEMRAHLTEGSRKRANTKEHLASMQEHNKKVWADPAFRKGHSERSKKLLTEKWADPDYRERISAQTVELNKRRWADPEFRERTSFSIRVAMHNPLEKKRRLKQARELANRPETRARSSRGMKARWDDPDQRAKMSERSSETQKKRMRDDPVYRAQKVEQLRKAAQSPEWRARMSEQNKKKWADPEYRAHRKALWTPERAAEQAAANAKRWSDPEYKARVSKAISEAKRRKNKERQERTK